MDTRKENLQVAIQIVKIHFHNLIKKIISERLF